MEKPRQSWARGALTLTLESVLLALLSFSEGGCGPGTDPPNERAGVESCQAEVRNDEWDIDCSAACNHVLACKPTGDSDLQSLTCNDCFGSCLAGVSLGGNDLVEGTDEDRRSWLCAAQVVGCDALDHNCDIF